jgi:hypothetical protein
MSISTLQSSTHLSNTYFSIQNEEAIQQQIRYGIYLKSKGKHTISNQDKEQLEIVMRSIFLQYSKNKPTDILNQILDLNKLVVEYCVNQIWVEIQQHEGYLRDIDVGMVPIDREMNLSKSSQILVNNKIGFNDDDIPIGSLL